VRLGGGGGVLEREKLFELCYKRRQIAGFRDDFSPSRWGIVYIRVHIVYLVQFT
jgi:hypothetical protein